MRRVIALVALLLAATGCRTAADRPPAPHEPDRALIFSTVLRRYLTTPAESSFGSGFAHIYVLDHTDGRAGQADGVAGIGTNITTGEQAAITAAVRDLGPVTFVGSRDEV